MWKALRFGFYCLVLLTALQATAVFSSPLINEMMPAPGSDWDGDHVPSSRDDEWVEIVNPGGAAVDLSGWYLLNGPNRAVVYGFSETLAPGSFACVYGSDALAWQRDNDAGSIGLSLNNSGDQIRLVNVMAGDTVVVDSVEYASSEVGSDVSLGRLTDGGAEWVLFDHFQPNGGTGTDPTPQASNSSDPPPHIFEVTRTPPFPTDEDSVVIAVAAGDAGGVDEARLAFDINLEDGEELPMTHLSGSGDLGTWCFTILPCAVGDTVRYRVIVRDTGMATTCSPWSGYRVRQCSLLVKLNEILADPPPDMAGDANRDQIRDASDDEFVEIMNCGGAAVDISGYMLRDDTKVRHVFGDGIVLQPGELVTVFGGGHPTGFSGKVYVASTGSLGLANSGDEVSLLDSRAGLVDIHSYGSEGGRDESIVCCPDCGDNWTLPSQCGNLEPFSPHEPNDPQSATAPSTWGGIKALYR